jgi:membrane-bound lytic murein transglycosylase D
VRRGESLSVIAARYDTSVRDLVALNGLRSRHRIRAGQTLRLPYTGQKIDATMDSYAVRRGDTVGTIAARAGMTETELVTLNSLDNRNRIYEGQVLQLRAAEIPADMPAVATVADAATTPANEVSSSDHTITELVSIVVEAPAETAAEMQDGNVLAEIQVDVERIDANAPAGDVLLADPSDYMVAEDGTIEVQAAETLGHYADWLGIRTQKLRDLNGYSFRQPLVIGRRLHLEFSAVDRETFVAHRVAYHREMQEAFFVRYRVTETTAHNLRRGESVWYLTLRRYKVPVWLLRQYNPDLDLGRVRPGMRVVFPQIEPIDVGSTPRRSIAEAS